MKNYLNVLTLMALVALLLPGCSGKQPSKGLSDISADVAAVELDADANGGVDIGKGGTNATTAAGARTNLGLGASDTVTHGVVTAAGAGGLKAGAEGSVRGAITLYSNVNPYAVGINSAATPTGTYTLTLPPGAPGGSNFLLNFDADGTGGYTDPASFAPALGADDNYVTDAEKTVIGNTSGTNTGDQTIPTVSDTAYDATSWNGNNDAATKNAIRDKIETIAGGTMTYPGAGIPLSTGSAWGTSYTLDTDLSSVSASDDTIPSAKATKTALDLKAPVASPTFTGTVTAPTYATSAADGARKSELPNNTSATPTGGGVEEIYNEGGQIKVVEADTEYNMLHSGDVDDTPVNGETAVPVSSNWAYDHTAASDPHTGYVLESGLGSGTLTMLGNAPGAEGGPTTTIETGTSALGTSAISSGACASAVTTAATNAATTDVINWGFNGDPTGVTGYAPTANGMLTIIAYPTSGNVNFKVCNLTAASITPGAITLNWRIQR